MNARRIHCVHGVYSEYILLTSTILAKIMHLKIKQTEGQETLKKDLYNKRTYS